MKTLLVIVSVFAVAYLFVGCSPNESRTPPPTHSPSEKANTALENQVGELNAKVGLIAATNEVLRKELAQLSQATEGLRALNSAQDKYFDRFSTAFTGHTNDVAQTINQHADLLNDFQRLLTKMPARQEIALDPANPSGFLRLDHASGFFLVSMKDVTTYLDGHKAMLQIGNPFEATFEGLKLNVKWGKKRQPGEDREKWYASLNQKKVSLTNKMLPGSWNPVEVVLVPSKADELGVLLIEASAETISMRTLPK